MYQLERQAAMGSLNDFHLGTFRREAGLDVDVSPSVSMVFELDGAYPYIP